VAEPAIDKGLGPAILNPALRRHATLPQERNFK